MKHILQATLILGFVLALGVAFTSEVSAQEKQQAQAKVQQGQRGALFIDEDGDGVCDNLGTKAATKAGKMRMEKKGKSFGPGDGTGNKGVGPRDGSGYGPGASSGNCDGTGPKGLGKGRRG
jgi:hypothetical protein